MRIHSDISHNLQEIYDPFYFLFLVLATKKTLSICLSFEFGP
jgi:hypothetical protein